MNKEETSKSACKKKSLGGVLRRGNFPANQKLELQKHDNIIKTKAVATKEGIWKGVFRPAELLKENYRWLRGIPITLNHPEGGVFDSSQAVGQVVDVEFDEEGNRVIADCEIWSEKCPPDLIEKIASGDPVDVSTGYYAVQERKPGMWNDQEYSEVEKTLFFDHLAIVPFGACSSQDGCGIGSHTKVEEVRVHGINEKDINDCKGKETGGYQMDNTDIKINTVEDLEGLTKSIVDLEDHEAKTLGVQALGVLLAQAKEKKGVFELPKVEQKEVAKPSYPLPKLIKAQDSDSLTLSFESTEDLEAAKNAMTSLYEETMKSLRSLIDEKNKLQEEKTKLQEEKIGIESEMRKDQLSLIQAHTGLSNEDMKVYDGLTVTQLKSIASHMDKALQTHSRDQRTKFKMPSEIVQNKKLTVDELNAEFDKALGIKSRK